MSAVSNTVLVMSETNSTLSKENDSKKKFIYNTATRKRIIQTFNLPALREKILVS